MDRKWIGVCGDKTSVPGTYEAACRWLDNETPSLNHVGFETEEPILGGYLKVKHQRYASGCASRPRNSFDIPREWQECKMGTAPPILYKILEYRNGFLDWNTCAVDDAVDALHRLGAKGVECLTPESERVLFAAMEGPSLS